MSGIIISACSLRLTIRNHYRLCFPLLILILFLQIILPAFHVVAQTTPVSSFRTTDDATTRTGAEQTEVYFPWLVGKSIAIVVNHTSTVDGRHLLDTLVAAGFDVAKVFAPEHGFRGEGEAGEVIGNSRDAKTNVMVVSLYGKKKKPSSEDLRGIEMVLFDIQDVGTRFYTYISTMTLVMEACAENGIPFVVLDRPNPNGFYVDGPVLDTAYRSFVGMHPVPIVHGMTMAEYALMVNGEGWLENGISADLRYVTTSNYTHNTFYTLPRKPSPNLPNMEAVYLYPSLGLFEGTNISIGRGTDFPFQVLGHPHLAPTGFSFTPRSIKGAALTPPHQGEICHGYDLRDFGRLFGQKVRRINLFWISSLYRELSGNTVFFNAYFNKLSGNATLQKQISEGMSENEIYDSWKNELRAFHSVRKKYLLYPDYR